MELFTSMSSSVIVQLFFGGVKNIDSLLIEDKKINTIICELLDDITTQTSSVIGLIFGHEFFKWGLRSQDKKIIKKLDSFKKFARKFVKERIEEIKVNKGELKEDYVSKIYKMNNEIES